MSNKEKDKKQVTSSSKDQMMLGSTRPTHSVDFTNVIEGKIRKHNQDLKKIIDELKLDDQKSKEIKTFVEKLNPKNPDDRTRLENFLKGLNLQIFKDEGKLKIFSDRLLKSKTIIPRAQSNLDPFSTPFMDHSGMGEDHSDLVDSKPRDFTSLRSNMSPSELLFKDILDNPSQYNIIIQPNANKSESKPKKAVSSKETSANSPVMTSPRSAVPKDTLSNFSTYNTGVDKENRKWIIAGGIALGLAIIILLIWLFL